MLETHRSFANTWECDENDHMNVQFYFKRFEEALSVLGAYRQPQDSVGAPIHCRHVRFHNEVHAANSLRIESGVIRQGEFEGRVGHMMFDATSGKLCATALDDIGESINSDHAFSDPEIGNVAPRGLDDEAIKPVDSEIQLSQHKAMISNYAVIRHHDLDGSGNFLSSRVVSMFTDGAPHLWERAGVTTRWLQANNFGRVAVEIKLQIMAKPELETSLRLVSNVAEIEGRTFRINHQVEEISSKRVIAAGSVRCLVMSLETRRAVSLPDAMTTDC